MLRINIFLIAIFIHHLLNSQVRVIYQVKPFELTKEQQANEIYSRTHADIQRLTFYLDYIKGRSHFYLNEGMEADSETLDFKDTASILYAGGEEFWADVQSDEVYKRANSEIVRYGSARPQWVITEQKKQIDSYECFKATYTFTFINRIGKPASRTIEAWFCPQLPYPAGPSKFFGLPGLILELSDGQGNRFDAISVQEMKDLSELKLPDKFISQEVYQKQMEEFRKSR